MKRNIRLKLEWFWRYIGLFTDRVPYALVAYSCFFQWLVFTSCLTRKKNRKSRRRKKKLEIIIGNPFSTRLDRSYGPFNRNMRRILYYTYTHSMHFRVRRNMLWVPLSVHLLLFIEITWDGTKKRRIIIIIIQKSSEENWIRQIWYFVWRTMANGQLIM